MAEPIVTNVTHLLMRHEAFRGKPYHDTSGILTIGYGRNLEAVGLFRDEAAALLDGDIARATAAAERYSWYTGLNAVRRAVVVDMIHNLGPTGFRKFARTRAAIAAGDYGKAATEMLDSLWARQVKSRARRLARMMETGAWPTF